MLALFATSAPAADAHQPGAALDSVGAASPSRYSRTNVPADHAAAVHRRAVRTPAPEWFWDRDADGWGSREWASGPYGVGGGAGAPIVTNCLDCDDLHASVFVAMTNMLPDCNGNHIADDGILSTVCVGAARTGPMIHGPDGRLIVNAIFADKDGNLWIPFEWAKKDAEGRFALDFEHGACPRM